MKSDLAREERLKSKNIKHFEKYGISFSDAKIKIIESGGICEICRKKPTMKHADTLCVDHDHYTGKFRGIICTKCNLGLSCFKDNPDSIISAAKYILSKK